MRDEIQRYWKIARHLSANMRLLLVGAALLGLGNAIFSTFLNLYIRAGGLETGFIGRLNSLGTIGTLAFAIPAGIFVTKLGRRWSLTFSILLIGIAAVLQVNTLVPLLLIAFQISISALNMLYNAAFNPEVMHSTSPTDRRVAFSLAFSVGTIAAIFACAFGGLLPRLFQHFGASAFLSLRLTLVTASLIIAASACFFAQIHDGTDCPAHPEPPARTQESAGWQRYAGRYILVQVIIGFGAGLSIPYLNLYFVDRFHASTVVVGNLFAVSNIVLSIAALLAPALARRIGPLRTVLLTNGISPVFLILMAFTHNIGLAALAFWARTGLMMCSSPITNQFCLELVPEEHQSLAQNVFQMAWTGAWACSTALGGRLIQSQGYTLPMLLTAACYLAYVAFFAVSFQEHPCMQQAQPATIPVPRD